MARKVLVIAAFAAALLLPGSGGHSAEAAHAVPASQAVDFYITGTVVARVPGRNRAVVEVKWDYKCLGDRLGPATYEWTLKVVRRQPKPEQTTPVTAGTTKRGSFRLSLGPGQYEPLADPFRCETDRGAGSTVPEVGRTFVVPDYCAWTVVAPRGQVSLEQRRAVKVARGGDTVRPGDVIITGKRSSVRLTSKGEESALTLGASSRIRIDARHCGRAGGWKLALGAGSLTAQVKPTADPKRQYRIESANAAASGGRARWTVETGNLGGQPSTRVRVLAGRVTVGNLKGGKPVVVGAGLSTTVVGSAAPTKPKR